VPDRTGREGAGERQPPFAVPLVDPDQLGRYVGYVSQEVTLFEGTIAQNIATSGGGVALDNPGNIENTIVDCLIENNTAFAAGTAGGLGGGVAVMGGSVFNNLTVWNSSGIANPAKTKRRVNDCIMPSMRSNDWGATDAPEPARFPKPVARELPTLKRRAGRNSV